MVVSVSVEHSLEADNWVAAIDVLLAWDDFSALYELIGVLASMTVGTVAVTMTVTVVIRVDLDYIEVNLLIFGLQSHDHFGVDVELDGA